MVYKRNWMLMIVVVFVVILLAGCSFSIGGDETEESATQDEELPSGEEEHAEAEEEEPNKKTMRGDQQQVVVEGENLDLPEDLPSFVPIIDGANVTYTVTYDEETLPNAQGVILVKYSHTGTFDELVDFYESSLSDGTFDEKEEARLLKNPISDNSYSVTAFKGDEKVLVEMKQDPDAEEDAEISILHMVDGK